MDLKGFAQKVKLGIFKYKYAGIILLVGLCLLLIPDKKVTNTSTVTQTVSTVQTLDTESLEQILQSIQGAGKVKVLLSTASGAETLYQVDSDTSADSGNVKQDTVIVTDSQRNETGLVRQINPPKFLGAIVICEGADSASVKFAVKQAVAKITGLGMDSVCVLKMK